MKITIPSPKRPNPVARAGFALAYSHVKGGEYPDDVLARLWPGDRDASAVLNRTAVDAGKTTVTGWASELVPSVAGGFLTTMTSSAAGSLIALGLRAAPGTTTFPTRSGALAAIPWVSEAGSIPVGARTIANVSLPVAKKLAAIIVVTRELIQRADAFEIFQTMFEEEIANTTDAVYFSSAAVSASGHAGLLNGISALAASPDGGVDAMRDDVMAVASAVTGSDSSGSVAFVMSGRQAMTLSILDPALAAQLTILKSSAVSDNTIIGVDPKSLIHSTDVAPELVWSDQATIHMESAPTAIGVAGSPNTVAAPTASLFQQALAGLRATYSIRFVARRTGAIAWVENANWGA